MPGGSSPVVGSSGGIISLVVITGGEPTGTSDRLTCRLVSSCVRFVYTMLLRLAMAEPLIRVGVREFREDLAEYLDSSIPVAITRHGQTVGYYIPARGEADEQELLALK